MVNYSQYMSARHSLFHSALLLHLALLLAFGNAGGPVALQAPAPLLATLLLAPQTADGECAAATACAAAPAAVTCKPCAVRNPPRPAVPALAPQRPLVRRKSLPRRRRSPKPLRQPRLRCRSRAQTRRQPIARCSRHAAMPRSSTTVRLPLALSRRLREQGRVVLNVHVLADGNGGRRQAASFQRFCASRRCGAGRRAWLEIRSGARGDEAVALWVHLAAEFSLDQP